MAPAAKDRSTSHRSQTLTQFVSTSGLEPPATRQVPSFDTSGWMSSRSVPWTMATHLGHAAQVRHFAAYGALHQSHSDASYHSRSRLEPLPDECQRLQNMVCNELVEVGHIGVALELKLDAAEPRKPKLKLGV